MNRLSGKETEEGTGGAENPRMEPFQLIIRENSFRLQTDQPRLRFRVSPLL